LRILLLWLGSVLMQRRLKRDEETWAGERSGGPELCCAGSLVLESVIRHFHHATVIKGMSDGAGFVRLSD
jgi:hypothetical protein